METRRKNRLLKSSVAFLALLLLFTSYVAAVVTPYDEEAMEAFFRQKTADNYERLVNEKINELKKINTFITDNPQPYDGDIRELMNYFILTLAPVYLMAIIISGLYLIFYSGSPEARTKAKNYLVTSIIAIGLIALTPQMLSIFFGLSKAVALMVLSLSPVDTEAPFVSGADYLLTQGSYIMIHNSPYSDHPTGVEQGGTPILFGSYMLLEALLLMMKLRFYMVALLAIIAPLTITLYIFIPTRGLGRLLAEQTALWTFSQVAMALVITVVAAGITLTSTITSFVVTPALIVVMELSGLLLLTFTPLLFVGIFSNFSK